MLQEWLLLGNQPWGIHVRADSWQDPDLVIYATVLLLKFLSILSKWLIISVINNNRVFCEEDFAIFITKIPNA